jgi:hypothetical protein
MHHSQRLAPTTAAVEAHTLQSRKSSDCECLIGNIHQAAKFSPWGRGEALWRGGGPSTASILTAGAAVSVHDVRAAANLLRHDARIKASVCRMAIASVCVSLLPSGAAVSRGHASLVTHSFRRRRPLATKLLAPRRKIDTDRRGWPLIPAAELILALCCLARDRLP